MVLFDSVDTDTLTEVVLDTPPSGTTDGAFIGIRLKSAELMILNCCVDHFRVML